MSDEKRFIDNIRIKGLTARTVRNFRELIYGHYHEHQRPMPWRRTKNPYRILLSEVMLQQTQVERVLVKYPEFLNSFPDLQALAEAPLAKVLRLWQGLGYNRRAISLRKLADIIVREYQGKLPMDPEVLVRLPGIGRYSASAIYTFAANKPICLIETNIRRVFIHFFFGDREGIRDDELIPLIEKTMDCKNPREWYYALMDYGVKLKKEVPNPNRRSAHYTRQSRFKGSDRQLRGIVLKILLHAPGMTKAAIKKRLPAVPDRCDQILDDLLKEGFIAATAGKLRIP